MNALTPLTDTTQTADVDIWNYWHFAFNCALVAIVTNSIAFGIAAAIINEVIVLIIGDLCWSRSPSASPVSPSLTASPVLMLRSLSPSTGLSTRSLA